MTDDSNHQNHAFTDEESCMNCQSGETLTVHAETGQYIGSWCENCGALNQKNGLFRSPKREYVSEKEVIDDLEALANEWEEIIESATTKEQRIQKICYGICAEDIKELIAEYRSDADE